MWKKMCKIFAAVPTPVAGLALGIASLGFGLENSLPLHSLGQIVGALVSFVLIAAVFMKFALRPTMFYDDLRHPVLGSIMPTLAMTLMVQSKSVALVSPKVATYVWFFAVGLHLLLLLGFVLYRCRSFSLQQMVPSWFVPFVGIGLAAITVPDAKYYDFAYLLMMAGMVNYAVMLPVMFYRLILSNEIADPAKPTIAIMAAPASLSLASYLALEPQPSLLLCSILLGIAVLMTLIVYMAFFKLLRLPFTPAFAAYTFPMAVGATALYKVAETLAQYPALLEYGAQIKSIAIVEMIIAIFVVWYVCYRYLTYYVQAWVAVMHARRTAKLEGAVL